MSIKRHVTCQVECTKGLTTCQVPCYIPHNTCNVLKICITWTQNVSRIIRWKKIEAKGRLGGRNCSVTLVLPALTTVGKYNVRAACCSCGSWLAKSIFCLQDLILDLYANPLYQRPKT
jgi:hypothetical protein